MVYWGEDLVAPPSYRVEQQRPHLQPTTPSRHHSANVAATAYALRWVEEVARGKEVVRANVAEEAECDASIVVGS